MIPRPLKSTLFPYTTLFRSRRPERGHPPHRRLAGGGRDPGDRKSTRLNSSHMSISYAVFCLKKKKDGSGEPTGRLGARHATQVRAASAGAAAHRGRAASGRTQQRWSDVGEGIFFFNDPPPTEIYTLSLHDALPI